MKFGEENSSGNFSIITGVIDFNVLAINPTLAELNAIGVAYNKEPEYVGVNPNTNAKRIRLDFWIKPAIKSIPELATMLTKHTIFVEDTVRKSKTDKYQYINAECKSTWAENENSFPEWFKAEGIRQCKGGEAELMEFLKNLANVKTLEFDNFNAVFNNNVSEIRELINFKKNNAVQLLATERDGYQSTYNKYSLRGGNTNMSLWTKHLDKNQPDINYQNTFHPKVWENKAPDTTESDDDVFTYDGFK